MLMSLSKKILINTAVQSIGKVISTILGVVAFGMITRYLDTGGFGAYTTITAFLQFFAIIADGGLSLIAIQLLSEPGDRQKKFAVCFTMRVTIISVFTVLAPLASLFFPYPNEIKIGIALMAVSFLISSLIQMGRVVFQVHLRMDIPLISDFVSYIILVAGVWAVIQMDWGLYGVIGVIIFNNVIQFLLLFLPARKFSPLQFAFDPAMARDIWKRTWPIALSIIFNLLYLRTDVIFLSLVKSQDDVGLYGAAYRVIDVLTSFPVMFMGLAMAPLAFAWSNGHGEAFNRYVQKSLDFMIISALPLVVGTLFVANDVMVLVSGDSFAQSGPILQILGVACGAVFFGSFFGHLITVINAQRAMLARYAITAFLGVIGYWILIPRYSYWGAAWMTVVSEVVIVILGATLFFQKTGLRVSLASAWKSACATSCMALLLFLLDNANLAIKVGGAAVVYGAVLYAIGGVPREIMAHIIPSLAKNSKP